jgi:4-nitrophenyl phosphatase
MKTFREESLRSVRAIALDLDGVVYHGRHLLPGADKAVEALRGFGLKVFFITNNSANTRADVARKLTYLGVPAAENEVLTSGHVTAVLVSRLRENARVLVIGSDGLKSELACLGSEVVAGLPCDFLVVGLDAHFNYDKICTALDALFGGAVFIACNCDSTYPIEDGRLLPGCGSLVAAIEAAWRRKHEYLAGKPNDLVMKMLAGENCLRPSEILVVGDSLESDIAMASHFGSPSVFVGAPKASRASGASEAGMPEPDFVIGTLAELPDLFSVI